MKSVLSTLIRLPLRVIPARAVVPVIAGPLRGLRWIAGSAPHGAWLGRLERETLADFAAHIAAGATVADVGANVGLYTLAAARRCGSSGHVVAFEPIGANVAILRRHVAMNGFANVTIVEAAVARQQGTLRMSAGDSHSEFHVDAAGDLTVKAVSLDEWFASGAMTPPTVVKIDVEGAEGEVLRGATRVMATARPRIYVAVHGEQPARECRAILDAARYTLTTASGERWPFEASEWIAIPR